MKKEEKNHPKRKVKNSVPKLEKEQSLNRIDIENNQHFTKAPPRFSEATLVKSLEEKGIGLSLIHI